MEKLCAKDVDVQRYYYWSLLDNLEWHDGYDPRFGLIEVDYKTMERKIRRSGEFYGEICREKGITNEMIETYLMEE